MNGAHLASCRQARTWSAKRASHSARGRARSTARPPAMRARWCAEKEALARWTLVMVKKRSIQAPAGAWNGGSLKSEGERIMVKTELGRFLRA
eukprot:scaffold100342_cov19-Tisochrysis_lutea.AAC.1